MKIPTGRRMTKDEFAKYFAGRHGMAPPANEYNVYIKATNKDGSSNGTHPNYPTTWGPNPADVSGPTGFEPPGMERPTGAERNMAGKLIGELTEEEGKSSFGGIWDWIKGNPGKTFEWGLEI